MYRYLYEHPSYRDLINSGRFIVKCTLTRAPSLPIIKNQTKQGIIAAAAAAFRLSLLLQEEVEVALWLHYMSMVMRIVPLLHRDHLGLSGKKSLGILCT